MFASPLRWWEINAAFVLGGVVGRAVVGAGVLAIALPLTHTAHLDGQVLFVLRSSGGVGGRCAGRRHRGSLASRDHVYSMEAIVLLPLVFLGGVFYSVGPLPPFWNMLSRFDPVFWLVQVERIAMLGRGDVGAVAALTVVWAMALALSVWSAAIFGTRRMLA